MRSPGFRWLTVFVALLGLTAPVLAQGGGGGGRPDFTEPKRPGGSRPIREAAPPAGSVRGGVVDLRPRFRMGEDVRYRMKLDTLSDVMLPGGVNPSDPLDIRRGPDGKPAAPPKQKLDQEFTLVLRPKQVDSEGAAVVELIYERVKIRYEYDGETMEFDSAAPKPADTKPGSPAGKPAPGTADPSGDLLRQLAGGVAGTTMTLTLDASGRIIKVDGGGALGLTGGLASLGVSGLPSNDQMLKNLFGPVQTRAGGSNLAKVGDRWTNDDELSMGPIGTLRMTTTHTVRSADDRSAIVGFTSEAATRTEGEQTPLSINSSRAMGQYEWDPRMGQLKSMIAEQTTSLSLRTSAGESGLDSTTTIRVDRQ